MRQNIVALMSHPTDSLTAHEQQWLDGLVSHISIGYGVGKAGKTPVHIRSAVYAGIMSALFASLAQMAERDSDKEMFHTGRDEAEDAFREAAVKYKLLPLH